jgi:hypothetical protein
MTSKLAKWSVILALPLSAVLAAPAERAVEVPLKANGMSATKSTTTRISGSTQTHKATASRRSGKTAKRQAMPVKEHNLSMRDVAPARPDDDGVYHSVHDWVPRTPTKDSSAQAQSEESNHAQQRAHWWSRPKNVASGQKAEEVKP